MSQVSQQLGFRASWLYAFWKFSRPHTIIGTSLSVLGLYLVAISLLPHSHYASYYPSGSHPSGVYNAGNLRNALALLLPNAEQLLGSWIACICGNIYIVGLNQLEDVAIDKINKPHLPIASGEFSRSQGKWIVITTGILALLVALLHGPFLFGMVSISLAIGTAYSLPPIRLKQFPFWAAVCIFSVRGAVVNLGLFLHFSWVFQQKLSIPLEVWILTLFILVFTFAIAIFKDIPDIEGDLQYNITTFSIKLGKQAVFNLALWVLTICYVTMIVVGVLGITSVNSIFLVTTHLIILLVMWWLSRQVDLQDKSAITQFYQFIWKLFFIEYLIFPIACLLG
jgi:homogentisate phytyltransferase/homogentisate geranylgeranyltransferase